MIKQMIKRKKMRKGVHFILIFKNNYRAGDAITT